MAQQMGPQDNLIICLAEPSWMLADLQGQDEEENFFKITSIARVPRRAHRRRDRRRLASLQPLLRQRARRALHHVGRRRRLPASDPRAARTRSRCAGRRRQRGAEERSRGRGDRHPRQGEAMEGASSYDIRLKRNTKAAETVVEQAVQDVQDALEPLQRNALGRLRKRRRCSRRRPSAIPTRRAAICSASATCCSRSTIPASPSASA